MFCFHQIPEAGDTLSISMDVNTLENKSSLCIPQNILTGYSMQWALNRPLVILNTQQIIYINAYKLATKSKQFKDLLRLNKDKSLIQTMNGTIRCSIRSRKTETIQHELDKFKYQHEELMLQNPLFMHCQNSKCIAELAFIIHYCHIGSCNITSIQCFNEEYYDYVNTTEKKNEINIKRIINKMNDNNIIYCHKNLIIKRFSINCTLQLGLYIANKYGLNELAETCYAYIRSECNPYTCWLIWKSTLIQTSSVGKEQERLKHLLPLNKYNVVIKTIDLKASKIVEEYILANFNQLLTLNDNSGNNNNNNNNNEILNNVYNKEQFMKFEDLTVDELEYLLTSDYLNINREGDVLNAIQLWLEITSAKLKNISLCINAAPRLLSRCVRIQYLGLTDLETIYEFPYLKHKPYQESTGNTSPSSHSSDMTRNIISNNKVNMAQRSPGCSSSSKTNSSTRQLTATRIACVTAFRQARRKLLRIYKNLRPLDELSESLDDSVINNQKELQLQVDTSTNSRAVRTLSTKTGNASSSSSLWHMELMNNPRIPHEAIFVFGGWQKGRPSQNVYVFDARKDEWITFEPQDETKKNDLSINDWIVLPTALMSFGICLVENRYVYIAGGEQADTKTTANVICLDLLGVFSRGSENDEEKSGWKTCPPLHESRRDLVLVNLNNQTLYAIGGDNNRSVLNSVEKYDLNEKSWMVGRGWNEAPSMLIARGAPAADSLEGAIYVCGGYTESRMETLTNSCEMLCLVTNQWTFIQPMAQARYYAQAISVEGVLFILGGGGPTRNEANVGYSSTVERYNAETGIWELMPPAKERADFAACLFENKLVCLGGGGEAFCTDEVETWKPWIPKAESDHHFPISDLFISQTDNDTISNPNTGPIWLTSAQQISNDNNTHWKKGTNLPIALWGHRCIVVKGCQIILPYLKRSTSVLQGNKACRILQENITTSCVFINNDLVIIPGTATENDEVEETEENRQQNSVGLLEQFTLTNNYQTREDYSANNGHDVNHQSSVFNDNVNLTSDVFMKPI